jgi:hypothetical protein
MRSILFRWLQASRVCPPVEPDGCFGPMSFLDQFLGLFRRAELLGRELGDRLRVANASPIDFKNLAHNDPTDWIIAIHKAQRLKCECECAIESFDFSQTDFAVLQ